MPRPRKYILPLSDLKCFEEIRLELESKPGLDNFDIDTAVITLKQRKHPYAAQPENLEKAHASLEQYITKKGITSPVELSKREMSDILCISRPTVDKWIDGGIIAPEIRNTIRGISLYSFTTQSVLKRLEELLDNQ